VFLKIVKRGRKQLCKCF